jgi:hypothetical protein
MERKRIELFTVCLQSNLACLGTCRPMMQRVARHEVSYGPRFVALWVLPGSLVGRHPLPIQVITTLDTANLQPHGKSFA